MIEQDTAKDGAVLDTKQILKKVPEETSKPYGLFVCVDGGSDRNIKNLSVQIAWSIMPTAILALQHMSFARDTMTEEYESLFRKAGTTKEIRDVINEPKNDIERYKQKEAWQSSMKLVRSNVEDRLTGMMYMNCPIKILSPASDDNINAAWEQIKQKIDSKHGPNMTQWNKARKACPDWMKFFKGHIKQDRYKLEIVKCLKPDCQVCMPMEHFELLSGQPVLVLLSCPKEKQSKPINFVEYKSYHDTKNDKISSHHRPSYKPPLTPDTELKQIDKSRVNNMPVYLNRNGKRGSESLKMYLKSLVMNTDVVMNCLALMEMAMGKMHWMCF
eukprot:15334656-Ditylum_brightwellii.AAC.1